MNLKLKSVWTHSWKIRFIYFQLDGFVVPHNYLSDDEGAMDDGAFQKQKFLPLSAAKRLQFEEDQYERDLIQMQRKGPSVIGCCWNDGQSNFPQELEQYRAVPLVPLPIPVQCDEIEEAAAAVAGVSGLGGSTGKRLVKDTDLPVLARILHGSTCSREVVADEFIAHLKRTRPEDKRGN